MYLTEGKRLLQSQPRDGIFHHTLRRLPNLLTKSSWDHGRLTSARRVAARDQLPRGDTQHT